MPRYRLWIEYDGGGFLGWQAQKAGASVQNALSEALFSYCGETVSIFGAGRTDSGVHALAQQAHFDLSQERSCDELRSAVNFHLHNQRKRISILAAERTADNFHTRFNAIKRHYFYLIINRPATPVLFADRVWHIFRPLDIAKMQAAAPLFIGRHDFTTFRAAACQAKSPVKTLDYLTIVEKASMILIEVGSKSFLHHQVRSLVGALIAVGLGKLSLSQTQFILEAGDRSLCPTVAPPQGLYLAGIDYPPPYDIKNYDPKIKEVFNEIFTPHT